MTVHTNRPDSAEQPDQTTQVAFSQRQELDIHPAQQVANKGTMDY